MPKPPKWVRSAQENGRKQVGKKAGSAIEPDGVDEWPEPTDPVTNGTEEDEDLVWIVDDNEKEGEEDEEDGEDELRSQEGRLDAVAPELAQFVTLFEQDTTHRKLLAAKARIARWRAVSRPMVSISRGVGGSRKHVLEGLGRDF